MKFIVDAQLPYGLSLFFQSKGFDCIHTDDLPNKERSSDDEIRNISEKQNRIVVTKDSDFMDSYYIKGIPKKLLIITTGNIINKDLYELVKSNFEQITELLKSNNLVEMNNQEIIIRE